MGDVYTFKVCLDANKNLIIDNDDDIPEVPIGGVAQLGIKLLIDDNPAKITSSTWSVNGLQILQSSVLQNQVEGRGSTQEGPQFYRGGADGDPSAIRVAWAETGTFSLTCEFTYLYEEVFGMYKMQMQAHVVGPSFYPERDDDPDFTYPPGVNRDGSENQIQFEINSQSVRFQWPQGVLVTGNRNGTIGFVQVINGFRCRSGPNGKQLKGAQTAFLDIGPEYEGCIFYTKQATDGSIGYFNFQDIPTEQCEDPCNYDQYFIGRPPTEPQVYKVYVAFKAEIQGYIRDSYVVVKNSFQYQVYFRARARACEEEYEGKESIYQCGTWDAPENWSLPAWTRCSADMMDWFNAN